jgi:CDP-diacylglycerol--glycerol-3-phosphate 3-phosphatidyltransferase
MNTELLFKKGKVWTLSNIISLLRLVLGIVVYHFIVTRQLTASIVLSVLIVLSDYADGYLARKRNEVSELGKVLDPLADKVCVALGAIALHLSYGLPLWVVVLLIARDVLIVIGSFILISRTRRVVASEIPGKLGVTVIALLLFAYLIEWEAAKPVLLVLAVLAVLISFGYYSWRFVQYMISHKEA